MKKVPLPTTITILTAAAIICLFAVHAARANSPKKKARGGGDTASCWYTDSAFTVYFTGEKTKHMSHGECEQHLKEHTKNHNSYCVVHDDGQSAQGICGARHLSTPAVTQPPHTHAPSGTNITQHAAFASAAELNRFLTAVGAQ